MSCYTTLHHTYSFSYNIRPISVVRFWMSKGLILSVRAEFILFIINFLKILSQQILAGVILVGRLGVLLS